MTDPTTSTASAAAAQTRGFQAEVKQLLQLMIHSLYSHPEIFLRELISNASDAADKLRFEALDHPDYYESDPDLRIRVAYDKEARTITVSDNGIGMSHDEVIAQHRHHRQVGHARILRLAVGRPGQGRAADRPVRRRLLFVVHRRRPGDAGHAPRRAARRTRACAGNRRARASTRSRRIDRAGSAAPTSRCTCAKARTSCCRAGGSPRSSASTPITSRCRS